MKKTIDHTLKSIGQFIPDNPFFLAPMAGFTDSAYRTICGEMGASLTYTEMVSAKGLYYGDRKSPLLLRIGPEEKPVGFQIFGSDPDIMAWAVERLEDCPNVLIDVNMGCPVPKVVKNGEGSALLRNPELVYRIINKMSGATDKPVTVKMRIGIEGMGSGGYLEVAQAIEEAGASALAVHGRTREQYYSGNADRGAIKDIKVKVNIPVIGNGDINSYGDADSMMKETGCDFVMIGRGALGNPWLFRECVEKWQNDGTSSDVVSSDDIKAMIVRHYMAIEKNKGEYIAVREMRKFVSRYLKGIAGSGEIKKKVNTVESGKEFCSLFSKGI